MTSTPAAAVLHLGRLVADVAGQTEVHDPHLAVTGQHGVFWFEIAMDQARDVRRCEAACGGQENFQNLAPRPRRCVDPELQGSTRHELHGHEHVVAEGADVIDDDHIRVRQASGRLSLPKQAHAALLAPVTDA